MSFVPFASGVSVLSALVAFLLLVPEDSVWRFHKSSEPIKSLSNSLFSKTFSSFMDNPFLSLTPFSSSLIVSSTRGTNHVGLYATKPIGPNELVLSISPDLTGLVIDGIHNIPLELSQLIGFSKLSDDVKTVLIIAFHKTNDLENSSPLGYLWKGVGVEPIPDHRWIKYKGIFTLTNGTISGIDEIDDAVSAASSVVADAVAFSRSHNLPRTFGISETEIKWSYVFLHAFGVLASDKSQRKILVAPLVFARHSINQARTLKLSPSPIGTLDIYTQQSLERGDELLVNGKPYLSDAYSFLFLGSWVSDTSIHRGKIRLVFENDFSIHHWFSNVEEESSEFRLSLIHQLLKKQTSPSDPWAELYAIDKILVALHEKLNAIRPKSVSDTPIERLRFIYFTGILSEIIYFESLLNEKRAEIFHV